jgi:hypothetical protein
MKKFGFVYINNEKYEYEIVYMSTPEEMEKNRFLKKLRNIIGYGEAWTFKDALKDFFMLGY